MKLLSLLAIPALLMSVGCAHNINITPNTDKLLAANDIQPGDKSVTYVISKQQESMIVTSPGGGGDKVSYKPYADLKTPLHVALGNIYSTVNNADSTDAAKAANKTDFILVPKITTDSSSSSALTWPPTEFSTVLACEIYDGNLNLLKSVEVTGTGNAEFDEFKSDFSLAARRSTEEALLKLIAQLRDLNLGN